MIKVARSIYEPNTKIAIHFGKTIRHLNLKEALHVSSEIKKCIHNIKRRKYA